mmetsp:Transcript_139230/g.445018  ORF Transcript_139230/g.445018 Transcript_139230/m.445018 type:complete len:216 (+) Transcript_139230:1251-1898(+)
MLSSLPQPRSASGEVKGVAMSGTSSGNRFLCRIKSALPKSQRVTVSFTPTHMKLSGWMSPCMMPALCRSAIPRSMPRRMPFSEASVSSGRLSSTCSKVKSHFSITMYAMLPSKKASRKFTICLEWDIIFNVSISTSAERHLLSKDLDGDALVSSPLRSKILTTTSGPLHLRLWAVCTDEKRPWAIFCIRRWSSWKLWEGGLQVLSLLVLLRATVA